MSRIFLSHSSKDDFPAVAVRDWLTENGWDDVFLDLDPIEGIHAGERWERALHEHAARCEAVVFLVSRNWLGSEWCRREYELARKLNKRIFVVLIDDIPIAELPFYLTETHQAVSLAAGEDHQVRRVTRPGTHEERHLTFSTEGFARLKAGLTQAGLDPRFFAWPPPNEPHRAPFRGLEPLESADAGIFFGREAPIIEVLDALRGLREAAGPRVFVILGASGAGKSSFLRAGLLPRLARDDRSFLPLTVIRPERAAVTGANGLVASLTAACADKEMTATRAQLREASTVDANALRPYLRDLAARAATASAAAKPPTLIIAIDQAEELFRAEGAAEGESLLTLLRDLVCTDDPAVIALFVIRSDSYDALEHAKPLEGLSQKAFPLLPMPRGAYQMVIEGPAGRLVRSGRQFTIDPSLTEVLLADLDKGGGSDALPLLAFTLEQLFSDHEASGRLTRDDYDAFGGLRGAIDAAVARVFAAADNDPRIPKDHEARLALLRRGLIPWLAGIDPETKTPRRRRAPATQIPEEARPLVDLLVEHRLLTRAVDDATHATTLEPAHEALLRQWGSLKGWLNEDFARLVTLEGIKRAARDWDANGRDIAWAAHGGARLDEATRLDTRADLAALLDATDRAYLAACREKENEGRSKELALAAAERRAAQRTRIGLVVSSILAVVAIAAAAVAVYKARDATQQTLTAEQRSAVLAASVSQSFTQEGALDQAMLLMLDAARVFDDATVPDEIRIAFTKALKKRERIETKSAFANMQVFDTDAAVVLVDPATKDIWKLINSTSPTRLLAGTPSDSPIAKLQQSIDGQEYIILRENLDVERINASTGARKKTGSLAEPKKLPGRSYELNDTKITDDGLIVRDFSVTIKDNSNAYYQAFDSATGRVIEGDVPTGFTVLRKSPSGGLYGLDGDGRVVELKPGKDSLVVTKPKLNDRDTAYAKYGACVAGMPNAVKTSVVKELDDSTPREIRCAKIGSNYLIEEVNYSSSGRTRTDLLFRSNGKKVDVRDILKSALSESLSYENFAWVGLFPPTQAQAASLKMEWLGIALNRSVYVLRHDVEAGTPDDGMEDWSLGLDYRHPTFVDAGHFIGPDQLIAIEGETGRIVLHDTAGKPKTNLFATPLDSLIGTETPTPKLLNPGTCVGYSIAQANAATMPDGRKISFDTSSMHDTTDHHQIVVAGSPDKIVMLGDDASCIQFSADWKRLLIVRANAIVIYDFQKVLQGAKLAEAELGTLTTTASPSSGLFVGPIGEKVVTTNATNHVLLWTQDAERGTWKSVEIYKGDNNIFYAEPDATGDRLILIERAGGGEVHGMLYSVDARQVWLDLGSDYKWLGAAFADNATVIVAEHTTWTRVFPMLPLSAFTALADKELSPECRPPSPRDYRHSPCWPPSYR